MKSLRPRYFLLFLLVLLVSFSSNVFCFDGELISKELVPLNPIYENFECYRITYLSDNLKVKGFLIKPKLENQKYPLLIYNRGGIREYGKITEPMLNYLAKYAVNRNYVVLASQYRGNDGGEGREEYGGKDVNDVLNLIPLAKTLPYVDTNQIVMLGISRGGMMTYLAIKRGAPIKAAAVIGGMADLLQCYNEHPEMRPHMDVYIGFPEKKEFEYRERSAVYWPEKINVPILILHGEEDDRVPVKQAQKMAEELGEAGKEYQLVVFPNGDHPLELYKKERSQMICDWFNKYLDK